MMRAFTKIRRETSNLDKIGQKYLGLHIETAVRYIVPCGIKSPQKCSLRVKCYRAVIRIDEE
jgi:hypothetical protein